MQDLTVFKQNPTHIMEYDESDLSDVDLASGLSSGIPSIRIDNKSFALAEDGTRTPIGDALAGVILKSGDKSRRYYAEAYSGGQSDRAPTCASNDGIKPDPSILEPQCDTCANCPQAVWGSCIGLGGKGVPACRSYRKLAICVFDKTWEDGYKIFRFDVPAGSLKNAATYGKELTKRYHTPVSAVVTKISFAKTGTTALEFDAVKILSAAQFGKIKSLKALPIVDDILNQQAMSSKKDIYDADEGGTTDQQQETTSQEKLPNSQTKSVPEEDPDDSIINVAEGDLEATLEDLDIQL